MLKFTLRFVCQTISNINNKIDHKKAKKKNYERAYKPKQTKEKSNHKHH